MANTTSNMRTDETRGSSVVLVTGASRGLGLAIVDDLLTSGIRVAAFARNVTVELADLGEKHPDSSLIGSVDVTDPTAYQSFIREVEERLGPIDGLVNNAAIGQDALHVHTSGEELRGIVDTNLVAPLLLTRWVIRRMLMRGLSGRVVNITSICGQRGFPGLVAYSATKGAMDAATRSLARELGGRILVNSVAPGFFESEMSSVLGTTQLESILRRTPSGRMTTPDDVIPIVRTLLLEATNINGQTIVVDGGSSI